MRIQHNVTALNAHRNLTNNNNALSKNLEKLSSGYRINRAGDDAAGLAISEKMRAQVAGLSSAKKNAEDGVSLVQTAEGVLTEVHSMLNRMVTLATQSANGTYSDANRKEMQKEIDALNEEINRISTTSNFNGTKLFTGGVTGPKESEIGLDTDGKVYTIDFATAVAAAITNAALKDEADGDITAAASDTKVTLTKADAYSDEFKKSMAENAKMAIDSVNDAIDSISSIRSDLGAIQNRLEHTINNLGVQNENITAAESRIRDVDMEEEMMAYTKNNILIQASQAMLAQANMVPQGVLQLLQ